MRAVVAIVQARMGSRRLPGKVLLDIAGAPMLWHVVQRARRAATLDRVLVATSTATADDAVAAWCATTGVECCRGSAHDVLERYYQAATRAEADVVVRLTADCPLLDPAVIDRVVTCFLTGAYDYVSNVAPPTFPDGLDTEVLSFAALQRAWQEARTPSEREHVTPYLRQHPELFRLGNVTHSPDLSGLRWTVDESADLVFVRAVYSSLSPREGPYGPAPTQWRQGLRPAPTQSRQRAGGEGLRPAPTQSRQGPCAGTQGPGDPHPNPLPEGRGAVKLAPLRPRSGGERALRPCADTVAPEGQAFGLYDICALLARQPALGQMNSHIVRNAGYASSLQEDHGL